MDGEEGEGDKHSGWLVVGTQEGLRGQVVGQADVRPGPLYQARRREGARMTPRDVVQACWRGVFAGRDQLVPFWAGRGAAQPARHGTKNGTL